MNKYTTEEGRFFVDIEKASQEELDKYYSSTGEIKPSSSSKSSLREFKKAIIKSTFDEINYPVGSIWIMGESPGIGINFFGEKITVIQQKDLYARIN